MVSCRVVLCRSFVCALVLGGAVFVAADARGADPLAWKSDDGEHALNLGIVSRFRAEMWDAHASNTDWFTAVRTRVAARYAWKSMVTAYLEFQDVRINRLDDDSSGAGALYRTHGGGDSNTSHDRIRQAWLEFQPVEGLKLRGGRQDIKLGTEVMYPEANWKYIKVARGSQRLVGTVGWSHNERSNDGAMVSYDTGDYLFYAFGAKPTTGVFDTNSAYSSQDDILYGGLTVTAKRGVLLPHAEVRLFGLAYEDDREADDGKGGLGFNGNTSPSLDPNDEIQIYTAGFSFISICPCRGGNIDVLLWGAYQWGDWADLDHQAWAVLFEAGYQWSQTEMKPWLRAGVNIASGDKSSTDGDHEAFFNMLPTNHLYYGFADRFALSNIVNYFLQFKLTPAPKWDVNLFLHHFKLLTDDDVNRFGTGAFNKTVFGYGARASTGSTSVGTEFDAVVNYNLNKHLGLQAGYAYMWGHSQFNHLADDDVRFAYVQATARY